MLRNILITGAAGFIPSAFTNHFVKLHPEYYFVVIDALYSCSSEYNLSDIRTATNFSFVHGRVQDIALLRSLFEKYKFDYVYHFAAQSHVDHSFARPMQYTMDNIVGTHCLLEVCREFNCVSKFLHMSTDEVYGESINTQHEPKTEDAVLCPTNPYSGTKAAAEMLVHSYIHSYSLPAIIVRSNNIYGPKQYPEKVVPSFILQVESGKKMTIQGNGSQKRSFLFIDDIVSALVCIIEKSPWIPASVYNIASDSEVSILQLASSILNIMKPGSSISAHIDFIDDRNFNDCRYFIKDNPLRSLGWSPLVKFDEGLKKTIEWYRTHDLNKHWPSWSQDDISNNTAFSSSLTSSFMSFVFCFNFWCSQFELSESSKKFLIGNGFDTSTALKELTKEDLDASDLNLGQKKSILKGVHSLLEKTIL